MSAGTIVVGVDGSEPAGGAVRWAAHEAAVRGADLRIVHAFDVAGLYAQASAVSVLDDVEERMQGESDRILNDASQLAAEVAPDVAVETAWVRQAPVLALREESSTALFVVIGSAGRGTLGSALGSVTLGIASHAECPVVVVRGEVAEAGPVVVGVDGGPLSDIALAHAFAEASLRRAPLLAVHVWSDADIRRSHLGDLFVNAPWEKMRDAEERALSERLAGWSERYPDVVVSRRIGQAEPAAALAEASEGAQAVVVATRGRGGFRGLLLGSTGLALIQKSASPVLLVGPDARATP
ncbi:universal stress protein [Pseudonocardia phyllosphaerae]|uniref:universal stress protein n=1 Tax=Pseudonocardia phyllosphaerae TaxID=3390502 RepID=UPI003978D7FA